MVLGVLADKRICHISAGDVLQCVGSVVCCSVLQCFAVCWQTSAFAISAPVMCCSVLKCGVLQCVAVCCRVLADKRICHISAGDVLQCVEVWCVAVCCSVLQGV